jgi:hypothetical protein
MFADRVQISNVGNATLAIGETGKADKLIIENDRRMNVTGGNLTAATGIYVGNISSPRNGTLNLSAGTFSTASSYLTL